MDNYFRQCKKCGAWMLQQDAKAVGRSFIANIGGHHMVCIKETCGLDGLHKVHDIWNSTDGCIGNYWTR